ncbi:hypothetical protein VNI00_019475 [Paramarasmius palmivorus]|uniref:DUF6535 domain-containing protein n=1 Tax=Paramarasmius palmivorus TaxID=297713 RepID=A0AAW0AKZ1_9AGAR
MGHNPARGSSTGSELNEETEKTEEEKMRGVYQQLEEDLRRENREQLGREGYEEQRKEEYRKAQWKREKEEKQKEAADRSYEKLRAEVKKYDDGMVAGYKEDIDTLLVFAGLFSAVVTAFLIESYQWLSEDTTVVILTQIFQQLNGTQAQSTQFTPEASSIRINCFWFLSLIFSLTSALFGLLCKQWLREHQRDVPTRTPGEDLALRQLRRDSFEKWGVALFLSALPILLEIALVLFFVGVLDLLWTLQPILFGVCLAAIGLSVGTYLLTTFLPTITITRDQARFIHTPFVDGNSQLSSYRDFGQLAYHFICPYKSPQAWVVYKLFTTLPKALLNIPFLDNLTKIHFLPLWDHIQAQTSSWSTFDLRVVRQFDQAVQGVFGSFQLQVYELQALQWAVTIFRDSPSMIPHLENVLETLPPIMAISAVLDRWDITMWVGEEWGIGTCLRSPNIPGYGPKPIISDPPLHSQQGIELLSWHRLWDTYMRILRKAEARSDIRDDWFSNLEREISLGIPMLSKTLQFPIPFPLVTALWSHKDSGIRQWSLQLLPHFEKSWKPSPGYDEKRHNKERVAFANALAWHITHSDLPSVLLMSKRGQEFIRLIHNQIIIRQLYSRGDFWWTTWQGAIQKVQEVNKLSDDYFAPLPCRNEDPPSSSQLPQLEPIRWSLDTVRTRPDNPQIEYEARPTVQNVEDNIDIQVLGSRGNTTSEIVNDSLGSHPLLPDNDEPLATKSVTGPANPGDSAARVAESITEASSIPLSAGEDDPGELSGVVASDTDQNHLEQAAEDGSQGERAKDDHEDPSLVSVPHDKHRERRRDEGRGWNTVNDPNYIRMHLLRP